MTPSGTRHPSPVTGNIIFVLLPPITRREFFLAYLLAAVARRLVAGLGVFAATVWFVELPLAHPLWVRVFAIAGSGVMGALGIIAGMHSDKVDQLAAFTNFIILPLTFLAGVSPLVSLAIVSACFFALSLLTLWLIRMGYKLRC